MTNKNSKQFFLELFTKIYYGDQSRLAKRFGTSGISLSRPSLEIPPQTTEYRCRKKQKIGTEIHII